MPRTTTRTQTRVRYVQKKETLNLANSVAVAIVGLLVSLVGTGIVSMIVLYTHVATLTEAETRTEQALAHHLDHSVDKDVYDKRDAAIQRQLNDKATKDDISELRDQIHQELVDLRDILHTVQDTARRR